MIQRYDFHGTDCWQEEKKIGKWIKYEDHLSAMQAQAKACADAFCNAEPFVNCAAACPYHGGCGVYKAILNAKPEEK